MDGVLQVFKFDGQNVRDVELDGQAWFCVNDVGEILGLKRASRDARRYLRREEVRAVLSSTKGKSGVKRHMLFANESGLYAMILRSEKPEAVNFRVWVTDEVLPSIKRTGSYSLPLLAGGTEEKHPAPLTMSGNIATTEVSFTYSYVFSEKMTAERFMLIRSKIDDLINAVREVSISLQ